MVCISGATGAKVWETLLPSRCEAGLAVTKDARWARGVASLGFLATNIQSDMPVCIVDSCAAHASCEIVYS